MSEEWWGVGDQAKAKSWGTARVGTETVELIHGQHPHSRCDNTTYARWPDGRVEAFNGHRVLERIEVSSSNYLKTSYLSGDEVRRWARAEIFFNDLLVYSLTHRTVDALLARVNGGLLDQLREFPVSLGSAAEREAMVGRPIYYRDTPAHITRVVWDQGAVIVEPEDGHRFPPSPFLDDDERDDWDKPDLLSRNIYWFRDADDQAARPLASGPAAVEAERVPSPSDVNVSTATCGSDAQKAPAGASDN